MSQFRTSGYFSVIHAGGVAVGVQKITRIPHSAARSRNASQKLSSKRPSSGSKRFHENSATRITPMPFSRMRRRSSRQRLLSQCSG